MKVSVIIPTYHRSQVIQRAVDSVLSQTIKDIEVIVVDDNGKGTPEGVATEIAMMKYKDNEKVVYVQHEENLNGATARNTGIKVAKGKYVSFLDDDDIYLPRRLELLADKLDKLDNSWGVCYSGYVKHMKNGKLQYSNEKVNGNLFLQVLMRSFYLGSGSNIFVRKEVFDNIGLFDESFKRNQDLEFLVRVTNRFMVAYVDEVLLEINYDIRTSFLSFLEQRKREDLFRRKFAHFLSDLTEREYKSITIMWNLDWIRLCFESKQYREMIRQIIKSRIPLKVYLSYIYYIGDRYKNNTSYGFVVKI